MKLLFVEDEPESIEPLKDLVREEGLVGQDPHVKNFEEAIKAIKDIRPDVIILDLFDGSLSERKDEGSKSLDFIRKEHFCPVIVYSAFPEIIEDKKHPFVHYIKKGSGSEKLALEKLREIEPHISVLRDVEEYVYETYSSVIREVARYAFNVCDGDEERVDVLKRVVRRRLAASMDEFLNYEDKLASWEQYIFPPISKDIRLGDVLKEKTYSGNDESDAFRIVLTPSCDLVKYGDERKVDNVLVSRCCSIKEGLKDAINLGGNITKRHKDRIKSFLSHGHSNGIIPLPPLKDHIPLIAVNLRDLQLIPADEIENSGSPATVKYERIASLDSPFREMVSWAYLEIAGRPGLPDRDFDEWIEEILDVSSQKTENGNDSA